MTSTQLHFLNTESDSVQESILITDVDLLVTQSTLPGYTRLHFKHSPSLKLKSTPECFRTVENYLKEQDVTAPDNAKQEDAENGEEVDCDVYTTSDYYSAHFIALYRHVTLRLQDPDSSFNIMTL